MTTGKQAICSLDKKKASGLNFPEAILFVKIYCCLYFLEVAVKAVKPLIPSFAYIS